MLQVKHALLMESSTLIESSSKLDSMADTFVHTRIKDLRDALKVTQSELGALAGVSKSAVSQWELGKTTPERDALLSMQRKRGINPDWVMHGKGEMLLPAGYAIREESINTEIFSPEETELVELFRRLTSAQRADIIGIIESRVTANEQIMNELGRPPASSGAPPPLPPGAFEATASRPRDTRKKAQK